MVITYKLHYFNLSICFSPHVYLRTIFMKPNRSLETDVGSSEMLGPTLPSLKHFSYLYVDCKHILMPAEYSVILISDFA